jgi:hypothetical protein
MKAARTRTVALLLALAACESASAQTRDWTIDLSLFGLAAGMDGTVGVAGVSSDLDVSFGDVLEHLEFGAMGAVRVGYDRWALSTEIVYMGLGASKNNVSADLNQWLVEPRLSYRPHPAVEPFAGVRYNSLSGDLTGPLGRTPTGGQHWADPILGAMVHLPLLKNVGFEFHGDIGGFGIGSDLTWQVFPSLSWRFTKAASLEVGYRLIDTDYETGTGISLFRYDVLTHGPQFGVTFHF